MRLRIVGDAVGVLSVVGRTSGQLRVYSLSDGSIRWSHDFEDTLQPVDVHYAGTSVILRTQDSLTGLDELDGSVRWTTNTDSDPAIDSSRVVVRQATSIVAIDSSNGQALWSVGLPGDPEFMERELIVVDRDATDPSAVALDPSTGAQRWKVGDVVLAPPKKGRPATDVGTILMGRSVVGVDLSSHDLLWSLPTGEGTASVAQDSGNVLVTRRTGGHAPGELLSVEQATGRILWKTSYDSTEQPAVDATTTYIGTYAADIRTGRERWYFDTSATGRGTAWVHGKPVVGQSVVTFSIGNSTNPGSNHVISIDKVTGREVWRQGVAHTMLSSLAGNADRVVVASTTEPVFCGGS